MSLIRSDSLKGSYIYPRMGTLEQPRTFRNQDFEVLREWHLKKGILFSDESFPPNINSIGLRLKNEFNTHKIEWKRPKEICQEPHFIVNGTSLFDIWQSRLGDCWVLSAIGSITLKPGLMGNIMPPDQGYTRSYAGIFHFRLWHLGEWVDIVIDDRLPFLNGKYLSVQPSCENEFWPCLLEKAYAKFLGSYQNLHWGDPADAFTNLTGGLTMTFDLRGTKAHHYWNMIQLASPDTLMACISDKQDPTSKIQNLKPRFYAGNRRGSVLDSKLAENPLLENGLVERHAYSITDYAMVPFRDTIVKLIRVWNPWGYGEWKGDWNDRCPLWKELSEKDRLRLLRIGEDGEFWMCWEDFIQEFSRLIICSQVPDFLDWGDQPKKWYKKMFQSRWTKDSMTWNTIDTDFLNSNPLYNIKVTGSDKVKSGENVVISVMQNSRNRQKAGDWLPIGFLLFQLPDSEDKPLNSVFTLEQISSITSFKKHYVVKAFNLAPGRYGIIPYTTQKEHESSFLFQVFLKSDDCTDDMGSQQSLKGLEVPTHETIFKNYATKGSKLYSWDLKRLLNDIVRKEYPYPYGAKFTIDGSREILTSLDISRKGKLDARTFANLWTLITQYKDLFSIMDTNHCGFLRLTELLTITQKAGFNVHNDLLQQLFARYSDAEGKLSFIDYLICMMRLKGALKTFDTLSTDGKGAYIHFEKWMQLMM
ncbi:calpain-13-like [Bufo gargarizans]|uniref:calpain-13-like n=1 Tax=Bufo gargarizans TaxID=30331 RepID=UPI001CF1679A|nr:calpain-13-like [Bufo gargarizans]